jgi:hypothetical protein
MFFCPVAQPLKRAAARHTPKLDRKYLLEYLIKYYVLLA